MKNLWRNLQAKAAWDSRLILTSAISMGADGRDAGRPRLAFVVSGL
jgi:hypothetical protein